MVTPGNFMKKPKFEIVAFRTVAIIYPHLSLEVKVKTAADDIVYANIDVNDVSESIPFDADIPIWIYSEALDRMELDSLEDYVVQLSNEERAELMNMLICLWNCCLSFDNAPAWRYRECYIGCSSYGFVCNGDPYNNACGQFDEMEVCDDEL